MELIYQGISGRTYHIEERKVDGGGEGSIHNIQDNELQVAKIFKEEKRSVEREEKLSCMIKSQPNEQQQEEITWPQDVIYNQNGFCGYIMPKVTKASALTTIYSSDGKKYDLRYRILAAINLCYAIQTVHNMGQVCGDLNPQNICINLDLKDKKQAFHVTLVDTDSYHFMFEGKTYRCEVGLADYIAPEVQKRMESGETLKTLPLPTYTKETDLFALAVHIFTLLMNGCHPFACAKEVNGTLKNTMNQMDESFLKDSVVAPQPIDNIKNGFFPFYEKKDGITYPLYAPSFDSLPQNVQNLFVRTFVEGYKEPSKRVDAQEWIDVLTPLNNSLIRCEKDEKHYYFSHNVSCPLCHIDHRIRKKIHPVIPNDTVEGQKSTESMNEGKKGKGKRTDVGTIIWLAICGLIALFFIIGAVSSEYKKRKSYYKENYEAETFEENTETKEKYKQYLSEAKKHLSASEYDKTIKLCNQALDINDKSCSALYLKGKALYKKKKLSEALNVLRLGKDIEINEDFDEYDSKLYSDLSALEHKVKRKIDEQKKKKKVDETCLRYGNKIKNKIKEKKYQAALKLIKKGYKKKYITARDKIYIKNGKLSKKISGGKGFVYYIWKDYAYIGTFKNGKANGKGIEVGDPEETGYGGYYTIKGNFKDGYPNGKCTVYYSRYDKDSSSTFIGTYKRGWENGSFTWIDKNFKGGHSDTYYFSSTMGKRKIIEVNKGEYVFAKANSGWYFYNSSKSGLSGHKTENHGKR